ncbi:MAG: hypothetical protein H6965_10185 [Chromatiaceae bacterium]|nr:hypothetical protein [Chromatiaceae bacterium]
MAGRIAVLWQYMYKAQIWLNILRARHGGIVLSVVLLFPLAASVFWSPEFQNALAHYYATEQEVDKLHALVLYVNDVVAQKRVNDVVALLN